MKKVIMILAAVLMVGTVSAQKEKEVGEPQRKKVAVVLSGGGAKGMAHIGVLKVLEKAGIPVDIVTGTSMGSIIGGLYAIGYNSHSLDSMVRVQDWSYVITDRENLRNQSLSDRKKQNTYFFSTGMTFGKKDQNAGGIIKGKNLAELFQQLCVGFTDSLDFNQLPIPFACVATDIITNEEVDFHSGKLPQAMRASMAIPAAFSPVRIGNKVLVDGGLKNNYPVDIAREMGAEIVIGVTVPLVVPGYSAAIFWIGCGLCLLAAAAVVAVGGDLDPAHRETAKQPSPAAHRSVEKTVSAPDWHDGPATQ